MNNMLIALQITALGMGLVFGAIVLLWGLMNLLTRMTADKEPASVMDEPPSGIPPAVMEDNLKVQAAAIAVAIALAGQQTSGHLLTEPPTTIVSAWQLGMRTRQMYQKGSSIARRAR